MKTAEERIALLHQRARDLKRHRERQWLSVWGSASAGMFVVLLIAVLRFTGGTHRIAGARFTGSSLLNESTGGYVLVAVVSFTAAMIITVICMRRHQKKTKSPDQYGKKDESDE